MLKDLRIVVSQRPDGMFQADSQDDRHGVGKTRGEALRNLGRYIDETDERAEALKANAIGDGTK